MIPGVVFVPGQVWIAITSRCFFPSSAETCNANQRERASEGKGRRVKKNTRCKANITLQDSIIYKYIHTLTDGCMPTRSGASSSSVIARQPKREIRAGMERAIHSNLRLSLSGPWTTTSQPFSLESQGSLGCYGKSKYSQPLEQKREWIETMDKKVNKNEPLWRWKKRMQIETFSAASSLSTSASTFAPCRC